MSEAGERKDDPVQPKPAPAPEKKLDWSDIAEKADEEEEAKNKQGKQKQANAGQTPTQAQLPSDSVTLSPQPRPKATGDIKVSLQITKEGVSRSCSVDEANVEKKGAHKGRETQEKKREMMDSHWSLSKVDLNEKKNTEQRRGKGTQQRKEKNSADEKSDEQEPSKNERDNENEMSKESTPHLDMKHGFVRDIIRNQLDRDAFEQRWQQQQLEKKKQEEEEKKAQEEEYRKKKDTKGRKSDDPLTTKSWGHDGFHELAAMEEKETMERSKKFEEQEQKRRLSHEERMKTRKPLTDSKPLYVPPSRREGYKPRVSSGGTPEASPVKESESKPTPSKPNASTLEKTPVKEQPQQQEATRRPQRERNSSGQAATPTQGKPRNSEGNTRKTPQSGSSSSGKAEEQTNRQVERSENRGHQKKEDAAHKSQYRRKDQVSAVEEKPVEAAGDRNSDQLSAGVDANVVQKAANEDFDASDDGDGEDPILFVGIELPDGQTAGMTVFKGDDPQTIAEEFCTKHSLSKIHIETIRQNIEYQLAPLDTDSS